MDSDLRSTLLETAKEYLEDNDLSHDFQHAWRVLQNAEMIVREEGGDLDILVPSALYHDVKKPNTGGSESVERSAETAKSILENIDRVPQEKIDGVYQAILSHSYSTDRDPQTLEEKILWDADKLESTGAVSIMRTFASAGVKGMSLYNADDPFVENREPSPERYALDFFYSRLLRIGEELYTDTAKALAAKRTNFLEDFLSQLQNEIWEDDYK